MNTINKLWALAIATVVTVLAVSGLSYCKHPPCHEKIMAGHFITDNVCDPGSHIDIVTTNFEEVAVCRCK